MLVEARRARTSRAAALVVAAAPTLCLLLATAALAQTDAAPPSAVEAAPSGEPPAPAKPEPESEPKSDPKSDPEANAKPDAKPDAKAKAEAVPNAAPQPAPTPDAAEPAAKPSAPATKPTQPSASSSSSPQPRPVVTPPTKAPSVAKPAAAAPSPAASSQAPSSSEKPKPPPEADARTLQLERDVKAALAKEPPDVRRLEDACGAWQPKKVFEERPLLGAMIPLCLARAAMLQDRDDHAGKKLDEALVALRSIPVDGDALELRAEVLFRRAELAEGAVQGFKRCGAALGLRRLGAWEAEELSRRLEQASGAYGEVLRAGSRRWARRALFRTGALYEGFYREIAGSLPDTYIGVALPSPFQVEEHDGAALLEPALAPRAAAWPREIARLYDAVRAETLRAGDDEKLLAEVEERRKAFRAFDALPREHAKNPWLPELKPGLLRRTQRGFEERTADGGWRILEEADARQRIDAALAGGVDDVESAWALVALSTAGVPAELTVLEQALASDDERIRLSALIALAEHPRAELYEPLVATWRKLSADPNERLFTSLQAALFGQKERAVVALRALADRERDLAGKLADEPRLPASVRAYLLAELGDNRLLPHYQKLAATSDRTTTAVALYGAYLAAGRRVIWSLRPNDPDPVGCVSRHLRAIEDETASLASHSARP